MRKKRVGVVDYSESVGIFEINDDEYKEPCKVEVIARHENIK